MKYLKVNYSDICLSATIYIMHKNKEALYINKVLERYTEIFGKFCERDRILKRIKYFKSIGFVNYEYKDTKQGKIPVYLRVTDKLLMFHKLYIIMGLLIYNEEQFSKVAEGEIEKILNYLKKKYKFISNKKIDGGD